MQRTTQTRDLKRTLHELKGVSIALALAVVGNGCGVLLGVSEPMFVSGDASTESRKDSAGGTRGDGATDTEDAMSPKVPRIDSGSDSGVSRDCSDLHAKRPDLPSGAYEIDPAGPPGQTPIIVYCDMAGEGGGWTLVVKADDRGNGAAGAERFSFAASTWTTTDRQDANYLINAGSTDLSMQSAKFDAFNRVTVSEFRIGMTISSSSTEIQYATLLLPGRPYASARAVFAGGEARISVPLPTAAWKALLPGAVHDAACEALGTNLGASSPMATDLKLRIGLVGQCAGWETFIGVGSGYRDRVVGNYAEFVAEPRNTGAFAYVFVR